MRGAIRSEWLKVRRPGILGTTVATIVVLSIAAVIVGLHELDRPRAHANVALYSRQDVVRAILAHSTDFLAIAGLGFAAFAFSTEFSGGTLRNLLIRQPGRLTLYAGKAIVIAAVIAGGVVLAYAVAFPVALVTAPHYGVTTALLDTIGHGGTADVGYVSALLVAAAWVAGFVVVGAVDLHRRDVAS